MRLEQSLPASTGILIGTISNVLLKVRPMNFNLKARINRSDPRTIRHALDQLAARGSVRK
jgi:hypothetical protein